jgi:hypothetical protein
MDVSLEDYTFSMRRKLLDDEAAQDGCKRMVPEYFANLSDPANPKNRIAQLSENSVGGIGREPSPNKLKDYFTDVCNQKTDPKYIKPEKKMKADKQIDMFGHVLRPSYHLAESADKEGIMATRVDDVTDPFSLQAHANSPPRRYGKAICKAKLDKLVADESANRCAGLPSEKVSETDERVVYDNDGDPIKWDGVPVQPSLQRHRGYAQNVVQRSLALQEVGCEFPTSPTRHRCLEGSKGEPVTVGDGKMLIKGKTRDQDGFRDHKRDPAEETLRKSNFVLG